MGISGGWDEAVILGMENVGLYNDIVLLVNSSHLLGRVRMNGTQ